MPNVLETLLVYAGSFVVVLSVVVFVHEFGHFQVARWRGVAIDTFSIGFGKRIFGWRDRHGVEWKIGALPLGGYVKFADDADAMSTAPQQEYETPEAKAEARRRGLFHAQGLGTRSMVVAAGPITNFIFSILAFATIALIMGRDVTNVDRVPARVAAIAQNTVASRAGLQAGDIIRTVDGAPVASFRALQEKISTAPGRQLALQIERNGQTLTLSVTPARRPAAAGPGHPAGEGMLGVSGPLILDSERQVVRYNPLQALGEGAEHTWDMVAQTGTYVAGVVTGRESGNQIAGPLGIVNVSGQVASAALDAPDATVLQKLQYLGLSLLNLAAVLSVAVGIVNLLPIPILDGGHLLFYLIEGLRGGRPLPPAAQEWAYRAGFAVMASFFLFATWNDITRLIPGAQ